MFSCPAWHMNHFHHGKKKQAGKQQCVETSYTTGSAWSKSWHSANMGQPVAWWSLIAYEMKRHHPFRSLCVSPPNFFLPPPHPPANPGRMGWGPGSETLPPASCGKSKEHLCWMWAPPDRLVPAPTLPKLGPQDPWGPSSPHLLPQLLHCPWSLPPSLLCLPCFFHLVSNSSF